MKCPVCGEKASKVVEKRTGHYRGEQVQVMSEFLRCEHCDEVYFTPEQMKKHNLSVKNEIRKRYGLLSPERVLQIRNKLELTQEELERLLGTGPKVVVRWESGKVIQSSGHDSLLRLMEREPKIVEDLRLIQQTRVSERKKNNRPQHDCVPV